MVPMNRPDARADESCAVSVLRVATVFEDGTTALCARRLIGRILRMPVREIPIEEYAWDFHVLDQPDGMAVAGRRANAADVLVIAAWRDSAALVRVIEWLQHWLAPRREKFGALVFISVERDQTGPAVDPMGERLAHVARQIEMDFFTTHVSPIAELLRDKGTLSSPHESHPLLYHFPTSRD